MFSFDVFLLPRTILHCYGPDVRALTSRIEACAELHGWHVVQWAGLGAHLPLEAGRRTVVFVPVRWDDYDKWTYALPLIRGDLTWKDVILVGVSEEEVPTVWKFYASVRFFAKTPTTLTVTKDTLLRQYQANTYDLPSLRVERA